MFENKNLKIKNNKKQNNIFTYSIKIKFKVFTQFCKNGNYKSKKQCPNKQN